MFRKLDDLRAAPPEHGKVRRFEGPHDLVVQATRGAIEDAGLKVKETTNDDDQTIFLAEREITAMSWGEFVRVIVQRTHSGTTIVRVLTMRRLSFNLTAKGDFSKAIFAGILARLTPG